MSEIVYYRIYNAGNKKCTYRIFEEDMKIYTKKENKIYVK